MLSLSKGFLIIFFFCLLEVTKRRTELSATCFRELRIKLVLVLVHKICLSIYWFTVTTLYPF